MTHAIMSHRARRLAFVALLAGATGPGCAREPGTLVVVGTGADSYYVADRTGERDLTGHRRTGDSVELAAGPYVVRLNGSRAAVRIKAGARVEVRAGILLVTGSGADSYFLADSAGELDLTGHRRTGTPLELFAGRYVVRLGERRVPIAIQPGVQTAVGP